MKPNRALFAAFMVPLCVGVGCSRAPLAEVRIAPAQAMEPTPLDLTEARSDKPQGDRPGCGWTGISVTPRDDKVPLCFSVDGACFAAIAPSFRGHLEAKFPEGRPAETGVHVEILEPTIFVSGWTAGDAVLLYPQRPIEMGSVLVTGAPQGLFVDRVRLGSLDLEFRGDEHVHLRKKPLHAHVLCSDLAIEENGWAPELALSTAGLLALKREERALALDQMVPVAATPGGAPILEIAPSEDGYTYVDFMEQRGQWSRVYWPDSGGGGVFGWVESILLSPPALPSSRVARGGSHRALAPRLPSPTELLCPSLVPLFAEVAGERVEVGAFPVGAPIDARRTTGQTEYTQIKIRTDWLELLGDARWVVKTSSLDGCSPR